MSHETTTTVAGNLTADPELRFTASGVSVAHVTVASTSRVQDSSSGKWRDGDTPFLRWTVWPRITGHIAAGLRESTRVVVTGRLHQQTCETDDGQKRSTIELVVDEVSVPPARDRPRRTVAGAHGRRPSHTADTPGREATRVSESGGTA